MPQASLRQTSENLHPHLLFSNAPHSGQQSLAVDREMKPESCLSSITPSSVRSMTTAVLLHGDPPRSCNDQRGLFAISELRATRLLVSLKEVQVAQAERGLLRFGHLFCIVGAKRSRRGMQTRGSTWKEGGQGGWSVSSPKQKQTLAQSMDVQKQN